MTELTRTFVKVKYLVLSFVQGILDISVQHLSRGPTLKLKQFQRHRSVVNYYCFHFNFSH